MNKHKYEDVRYKIDKPTNIDESLGYEGGMKGFGCTIIFVIVAFVISAGDIIDAGSFEESMEYVRIILFVCFFIFLYNLKEYIYVDTPSYAQVLHFSRNTCEHSLRVWIEYILMCGRITFKYQWLKIANVSCCSF